MNLSPAEILEKHQIPKTSFRELVIAILMENKEALSQKEIETKIPGSTDRVTLYRTLKLFDNKGLIHKIILDDQNVKYKLINEQIGVSHPHFHCRKCHRVICLPQVELPSCELPEGFSEAQCNLLVEGICNNCNQ
ncbi:transcriptional repressor [Marinilabiliaceae bacterium JC017]|nr:transcriptional repressor [Marinilabiliaceae bacterium JC017]